MTTQVTLIASNGKWITETDMTLEERMFTTIITLPSFDLVPNYTEVTNEWKEEWEKEHEKEDE